MAKKIVETPLMKQYIEMKQKHPDAVLLFRVGDFYETFSDDAITASEILGITLTRRANGSAQSVELAGFPHHALDTYLPRLVRAGKRVAICEQLEDPKLAKKLVKRGITELVTPGVSMGDNLLNHRENNFLGAVYFGDHNIVGVAFLDISTGEFLTAEGSADYVDKLITNFGPKEVVVEQGRRKQTLETFSSKFLITEMEDWVFNHPTAMTRLLKQFETGSLKGFGVDGLEKGIVAAGAILYYLDRTQHTQTRHIASLSRIEEERYVRLDSFTVRNLELLTGMADSGRSLLSVIDRTLTPMGSRLLRRWIIFPVKDAAAINRRLDVVEHFFRMPDLHEALESLLAQAGDMERLAGKVAVGRVSPREMGQLCRSLDVIAPVKELCMSAGLEPLTAIADQLNELEEVRKRISATVVEDAPVALNRGQVVKSNVNAELDELREIAYSGKDYLVRLQAREAEATGIPSLKVGYNNVFGYYLEVTNTHRAKVPDGWIRKQTLVNAERYITQELKEYETKILNAQERIAEIEARIYTELVAFVTDYVGVIKLNASLIARLDVLAGFAAVSRDNRYNRPVVDNSLTLKLTEARHPVIERELPPGEPYISNSVELENDGNQILMITGPNMSGKSALLRQTALNVVMAQIGCFVAAESAHIGVVDKIFTRVGASDNIALGESTFMVEMNEAASIMNNMSRRSLILFDELGRGTSTYDGISIAWAIVEYLHEHGSEQPKTLFATHYHELNEMEKSFPRVVNYNVSVKEIDGKVVFLRKLAKGGSEHSFGIHVAKLAGMPRVIVDRASRVLRQLEGESAREVKTSRKKVSGLKAPTEALSQSGGGVQMSFFQLDDPVLSQVRDEIIKADINNLTPVEALNKLNDIKKILTGKDS